MHTEEDVKVQHLIPLLNSLGYKTAFCDFEVAIKIQEGRKTKTIFADAIVYDSAKKKVPLLLCETKAPNEILNKGAREQAISYARLLDQIAPLTLLTNGAQTQVFHTISKKRLPTLPRKMDLTQDLVRYTLSDEQIGALRDEAKHTLFIIDDVSAFKSILQACHNAIRNNDGKDPTEAFDEMSKLLFCKLHEERRGGDNRFTLAAYDKAQRDFNVNLVQQLFDETKANPRYSGLFDAGVTISLQPRTMRRIVDLFQDYDLSLTAFDVKGEAFEYFLSDTFTGGLGEYFTPRNVVEFMVAAVEPLIGHKIVDPFCGTGGFLLYAFEVVSEKIRLHEFSEDQKGEMLFDLSNKSLFGTDWKERTSQACKMNMTVHGDGSAGIFKHDGLTDVDGSITEGQFDICLTNPPFGSDETDSAILSRYELGAGRKSQERLILGIERSIRLVKPGRTVAIVIIDGVLNNSSTRYVRDYIRRETDVKAVISLTEETFKGYGAGAKTSVVILRRRETPRVDGEIQPEPVFMALAANTGYAPNGDSIPGNELPDILIDYRKFVATGTIERPVSLSWTAALSDRLDAEHYLSKAATLKSPSEIISSAQKAVSYLTKSSTLLEEVQGAIESFGGTEIIWRKYTMSDLLVETNEPVKVKKGEHYRQLGVSGLGLGSFIRVPKPGKESKATKLYKVHAGELIYNKLFAFKGSFAVVTAEQEGCYVSPEFPTFRFRDDAPINDEPILRAAVMKFIAYTLMSDPYMHKVDRDSTGSTKASRNRYDSKLFLALTIQLPTEPLKTLELVTAFEAAGQAFIEQQQAVETLKAIRRDVTFIIPPPLEE